MEGPEGEGRMPNGEERKLSEERAIEAARAVYDSDMKAAELRLGNERLAELEHKLGENLAEKIEDSSERGDVGRTADLLAALELRKDSEPTDESAKMNSLATAYNAALERLERSKNQLETQLKLPEANRQIAVDPVNLKKLKEKIRVYILKAGVLSKGSSALGGK